PVRLRLAGLHLRRQLRTLARDRARLAGAADGARTCRGARLHGRARLPAAGHHRRDQLIALSFFAFSAFSFSALAFSFSAFAFSPFALSSSALPLPFSAFSGAAAAASRAAVSPAAARS